MKSIFHHLQKAFNEANNTIFLEVESPTFKLSALVFTDKKLLTIFKAFNFYPIVTSTISNFLK